jgi:hypothetical protein
VELPAESTVLAGVAYKLAIYIELIHRTTRVNYKQNIELLIDRAEWGDIPGAPPLFHLPFNIRQKAFFDVRISPKLFIYKNEFPPPTKRTVPLLRRPTGYYCLGHYLRFTVIHEPHTHTHTN